VNKHPLRAIAEDEIRRYEEDGFLLVKGLFDLDWVEAMREAVDEVLARPGPQSMEIAGDDGTPGRFTFDAWIWTYNKKFGDVVFNCPAPEIAATFMRAKRVNLVFDYIAVKEPHTPKTTAWHQDAPGNPVEGLQSCSMWIALDHVTPESGAMRYARGSHKWGKAFEPVGSGNVYKHAAYAGRSDDEQRPDGLHQMPDIDADPARYGVATVGAEPGDFIIHNLMTVHAAGGNNSDRRRRAFGLRFAGEQATYAIRRTKLNIRPLADPGLRDGDHFPADPKHRYFPMMWPRAA
jgi:ectoine hydroxylase-related dioxygenase (phytanoyl-CoA dioxygenase family)